MIDIAFLHGCQVPTIVFIYEASNFQNQVLFLSTFVHVSFSYNLLHPKDKFDSKN